MKPFRLSALAVLVAFSLPVAAADPVFSFDGQTYTDANLPARLRQEFHSLALEMRAKQQQAIDNYVIETWLEAEARKAGVTPREIQNRVFKVDVPDDAAIKAFYEQNQARMPGTLEQMKEQIRQYLQNQQFREQVQALLARLKEEKGYAVLLAQPEAPRFSVNTRGYPAKGPENAPVTLVEFADYQCPHCKDAAPVMDRLVEKYGDKLRFVYRDFPINPSGISRKIAYGAVCADEQGKFWAYHDTAFARQAYLKSITPEMLAKEVGLDTGAFSTCYAKEATRKKVDESYAEGEALGISGTPTFFVNGRLVHASPDLEADLSRVIDASLKEAGSKE